MDPNIPLNVMLKNSIISMYMGDPVSQKNANEWLNAFAGTPPAWEAALECLQQEDSTEILFFCSNMLLHKVRTEWIQLNIAQRQHVAAVVRDKTAQLLHHGTAPMVTKHLALVIAGIAARSGDAGIHEFVSSALNGASAAATAGGQEGALQHSMLILTRIAEEVDGMDRARRTALTKALLPHLVDVLSLSSRIISATVAAGCRVPQIATAATTCIYAWLKLHPSGSGELAMSFNELCARAPSLLTDSMALIVSEGAGMDKGEEMVESAVDLLVSLLGESTRGGGDEVTERSVGGVISALLEGRHKMSAPAPLGPIVTLAVSRILTCLAESNTELVSRPSGPAALLAELALAVLEQGQKGPSGAVLDYFVALNTMPVSERHPDLAGPIWGRLVPLALRLAQYPEGFMGWEDGGLDEDEDEFYRFREQQLLDVLEASYLLLRTAYLTSLAALLRSVAGGPSWQALEAGLFGLHAVAVSVKSRVVSPRPADLAGDPNRNNEMAEAGSVLGEIFRELTSPGGYMVRWLPHPWLHLILSQLMGDYAAWFAKDASAPLEQAVSLLIAGIGQPPAAAAACAAFRTLCVRCGDRVLAAGPGPLLALMGAAVPVVAPSLSDGCAVPKSHLTLEDRSSVVEGLAKLVAALPVLQAAEAGVMLVQPFLLRAKALATAPGSGSGQAGSSGQDMGSRLACMRDEVTLVSSALRHMEFSEITLAASGVGGGGEGGGVRHPALTILESAWPLLSALTTAEVCTKDAGVMEAVCLVLQRSLSSAKASSRPLLPPLFTMVVNMFVASLSPACLDVLAAVVEVFGRVAGEGGEDVGRLQEQAVETCCNTAFRELTSHTSNLSSRGDLLHALMSLADRHIVFARDMLLRSPVLPGLMHWACSAVTLRERDPVAAAHAFLRGLMAAPENMDSSEEAPLVARIDELVSGCGAELTRLLMLSAGSSCPRGQLRSLAALLWSLTRSRVWGSRGAGWVAAAFSMKEYTEALQPEELQRLGSLLLRNPPLARNRFDALVADMAGVLRGEATSDVLLAYEM